VQPLLTYIEERKERSKEGENVERKVRCPRPRGMLKIVGISKKDIFL